MDEIELNSLIERIIKKLNIIVNDLEGKYLIEFSMDIGIMETIIKSNKILQVTFSEILEDLRELDFNKNNDELARKILSELNNILKNERK